MKRLALVLIMMVSSWAQPTEPTLPPSTVDLLREQGWQATTPDEGEWSAWSRGESRLTWRQWSPEMEGVRWQLGAEQCRYLAAEGQATLGLGRGWAFGATGDEDFQADLRALASTLSSDGTLWTTAGQSVKGRPIDLVRMGHGPNKTLFFAVFHGDEPAGEAALRRLVQYLAKTPSALSGRTVLICPVLNPDGLAADTRVNANRVDVNRNFPAKNWSSEGEGTRYWGGAAPGSEPETKIVMEIIADFSPAKIVTIHAPLHNVNFDGPAAKLAERMSRLNGYPVEPDIGYPTPGSFGTYVGRERKIPTITLEFPEGDGEAMWLENKQALLEAIRYEQKD